MLANLLQQPDPLCSWGALIYLVARIAYLPLYILGVVYVRSLVWTVSAIGLMVMFLAVAF